MTDHIYNAFRENAVSDGGEVGMNALKMNIKSWNLYQLSRAKSLGH